MLSLQRFKFYKTWGGTHGAVEDVCTLRSEDPASGGGARVTRVKCFGCFQLTWRTQALWQVSEVSFGHLPHLSDLPRPRLLSKNSQDMWGAMKIGNWTLEWCIGWHESSVYAVFLIACKIIWQQKGETGKNNLYRTLVQNKTSNSRIW